MGREIHILVVGQDVSANKILAYRLREQIYSRLELSIEQTSYVGSLNHRTSHVCVYEHPHDICEKVIHRSFLDDASLVDPCDIDAVIIIADQDSSTLLYELAEQLFPYAIVMSPTHDSSFCLGASCEQISDNLAMCTSHFLFHAFCQYRLYLDLLSSDHERENIVRRIVAQAQQQRKNYEEMTRLCLTIFKKELRNQIQLSKTDALTHVANRIALEEQAIDMHDLVVLLLDVNNLKQINDTRGHLEGDKVLADTAARISRCVRRGDRVFRYGGDEFVILLKGVHSVELIVQRLYHNVPNVTIGYCLSDGTHCSLSEMIHIADQHMYKTKRKEA